MNKHQLAKSEASLFDLFEQFLSQPEHQIGIPGHDKEIGCGKAIINPRCERCRLLVAGATFALQVRDGVLQPASRRYASCDPKSCAAYIQCLIAHWSQGAELAKAEDYLERIEQARLVAETQILEQQTIKEAEKKILIQEIESHAATKAQVQGLKARITELEDALRQNIACFEKVSAKITEFTFWLAGKRPA